MDNQITIKEALELVSFTENDYYGGWEVKDVMGIVYGNVLSDVRGDVKGSVYGGVGGTVFGSVGGDVGRVCCSVYGSVGRHVGGSIGGSVLGTVKGDIDSDEWQRVETPKQKLKRLIEETNNSELIELYNQLEDNS